MTVKTYLENLEAKTAGYPETTKREILDAVEIWDNDACAGYAAAAAMAAGLDHRQTVKLLDALQAAFENMDTDEARDLYESKNY